MKKLIIIASLSIASIVAHAQASNITITNNTPCPVFYEILGDVNSLCGISYESGVFSLNPGLSVNYTVGNVPNGINCTSSCTPSSLGTNDYINGVRILSNFGGCAPAMIDLGETCTSLPTTWTYNAQICPCAFCSVATAVYTPASSIGGTALLLFQ